MQIAVTGATGHVGANVVRDLLHHQFQVKALCHPDADRAALQGLAVEMVAADILAPHCLTNVFQDVDAVIHLAAKISISGDPDGMVMRTNAEGTRNVARACLAAGVAKLIHMSSIHAFKSSPYLERLDESSPKADENNFLYDQSKAAGEREVHAAVEAGLNATILNPTGILGPHDYCASLGGQMLRNMFKGKMPALINAGFDWVDVRDVATAIRQAIRVSKSGEQYLLSGKWVSFRELARHCETVSGNPAPQLTLPWWVGVLGMPLSLLQNRLTGGNLPYTYESLKILRNSSKNCCSAKASLELGFTARPLSETIFDTYEWSRQKGLI